MMKTISRLRFSSSFALAGAGVPAIILIFWWAAKWAGALTGESSYLLSQIAVLVWPSSIFLLASENQSVSTSMTIIAASITINVGLYALIGLWVWYGVYWRKWMLVPLVLAVAALWRLLLNI